VLPRKVVQVVNGVRIEFVIVFERIAYESTEPEDSESGKASVKGPVEVDSEKTTTKEAAVVLEVVWLPCKVKVVAERIVIVVVAARADA
jgi:hypothetical protein